MKFLHLRDFDDITAALNFDAPDCHVVGGCDLYTTKAAGVDKKLYKSIDRSLESQYESLLRLSASLSPPQGSTQLPSVNLSRSSPFGPLSQVSSRRTFTYLIATLNASHPDYDFSHILRPSDFRRERSLKSVINRIDSTLYNLRPRPVAASLNVPPHWATAPALKAAPVANGSQTWGPRMWRMIDKEMDLQHCSIYYYAPDEDPYDGEDGAIWSENYFFFSKVKKRVCYLYFRGLSVIGRSPALKAVSMNGQGYKTSANNALFDFDTSLSHSGQGLSILTAGSSEEFNGWDGEEEFYHDMDMLSEDGSPYRWGDDEVDMDNVLDDGDEPVFISLDDMQEPQAAGRHIRSISEDMVEAMEV